LFGTFTFDSPRLEHCDCTRHKTSSFRPLSALLTESVAPELLYMEAKWSSLVSYGMSLDALQDFLPLDLSLDSNSRRRPILLKINDLSHLAFVNIKSIESITYAFYAASNGQVFN
jgi:hypothetical protein